MLTVLFFFLLILVLVMIITTYHNRNVGFWDDGIDETVHTHTTTTTTTTVDPVAQQPTYQVVGQLVRQYDGNGMSFVVDPADGDAVYVSTTDDLYEDGQFRVWRLV